MTTHLLAVMAPPQGQGGGMSFLLVQLGLIALVFYFLIIRPQSQARKKHQELLNNLKRGDEVVTGGGLIGKVTAMDGERITVQTGEATVIVHRRRIIQVGDAVAPGQEPR